MFCIFANFAFSHALTIENVFSKFKSGQITAMASSFSTEMPTSSGVFSEETKQPFMTSVIEEKFETVKEVR